MQDLGDLAGGPNHSIAWAINSFDTVVGESGASGTFSTHAMIWTVSGGMKDLNNMLDSSGTGWILSKAVAINDAGQIVGEGRSPDGSIRHVFLLTPVPEPPALLLLGIGAISLLGYRKAKSRR